MKTRRALITLTAFASALTAGPDLELRGVVGDEHGVFCSLHDLRHGDSTLARPGLGADDWQLVEYLPDKGVAVVHRDGALHEIPLASSRISVSGNPYPLFNHASSSGRTLPDDPQGQSPRIRPAIETPPPGTIAVHRSTLRREAGAIMLSRRDEPASTEPMQGRRETTTGSTDVFSGMARRPMTDAAIQRTIDVVTENYALGGMASP